MKLNVKALHPDAIVPQYATDGAACFDLHALIPDVPKEACVFPIKPAAIRTGLAFEIPDGYVMLIFSRSGHGFKNDIRLANCVGVIDSDYRGEVQVKLSNDNPQGLRFDVKHGDRIAQAMIVPVERVELVQVDELSSTSRGEGGFGSTGTERSFIGMPKE
jgi:dUTP pyrophosphatase